MIDLPDIITPTDLARHLGCSERTLRETARRHGCCHLIGKKMVFTPDDIEKLLEATKVRGKTPAVQTRSSNVEVAAMILRAKAASRKSRPRSKSSS